MENNILIEAIPRIFLFFLDKSFNDTAEAQQMIA